MIVWNRQLYLKALSINFFPQIETNVPPIPINVMPMLSATIPTAHTTVAAEKDSTATAESALVAATFTIFFPYFLP